MKKKEKYLRFPLGKVDIGGKIEVENISLHKFDSMNGNHWYEMQIIVHFRTIWAGNIPITHSARLRHKLTYNEVEKLQKKGIIRINLEEYKEFLKNLK